MIKERYLIAFDMDGTLLKDGDKIILKKTKEYLLQLIKDGHKIILASGRPKSELMPYYNELGLDTPLVCFNGIHCFNPKNPTFPEIKRTYKREKLFNIIKQLKGKSITNAFVEDDENVWMLERDDDLYKVMWLHGSEKEIIYGPFEETLTADPMTLITICKGMESDVEHYQNVVKKYKKAKVRFWWNNQCGEVYFGKVSKGKCLEHIRKYYKIKKKNTIAFGDYTNDLEMIKWARVGVAMQNACQELKNAANIVTKFDNNNDGILFALKEIIEKRG